ncbi:hypothetical protein JZ751_018643 [Albula glossodonta]|uniref:Uncharacterized protein n=1 Tax=Albula glossodonta TaxID=121402 RepID=A0A8T2MU79_9TELE|nr:hypothetical protein JZ751_018643 [Albula glossodonta]
MSEFVDLTCQIQRWSPCLPRVYHAKRVFEKSLQRGDGTSRVRRRETGGAKKQTKDPAGRKEIETLGKEGGEGEEEELEEEEEEKPALRGTQVQ